MSDAVTSRRGCTVDTRLDDVEGRNPPSAEWMMAGGGIDLLWAVLSAGLAPVLLVAGWVVGDALQPASYSPIRQTVSVLAGHGGADRWVMTGALFLVGGCYFVTAAGLTALRVSARILLVVAGVASIGIAASPEPAVGSTPQHLAWTALGEISIALWPALVARSSPSAPSSTILSVRASVIASGLSVALLGWLIIETRNGSLLGLAERATSGIQVSWPFVVAFALWRSTSREVVPMTGLEGGRSWVSESSAAAG